MPLTIVGVFTVTVATWSVTVWEGAHKVINLGSAFLLPGAILVALWGLRDLIRLQMGGGQASIGEKVWAFLRDPVRFSVCSN